jgi:hypothetical protein
MVAFRANIQVVGSSCLDMQCLYMIFLKRKNTSDISILTIQVPAVIASARYLEQRS